VKLGLLAATLALAVHARFRLVPSLDAGGLSDLAYHIVGVTLLGVAMVITGVAIRTGGLWSGALEHPGARGAADGNHRSEGGQRVLARPPRSQEPDDDAAERHLDRLLGAGPDLAHSQSDRKS